MALKFEKIPGKNQSPIWNVIHENHFIGRIEPDATGRLGFSTSQGYVAIGVWLTEITAFIRQQSGEAAPAATDPALEKRVAELEKLVAPMVEREARITDAEFFILKRCREIAMVSKFNLARDTSSPRGWSILGQSDARRLEKILHEELRGNIEELAAQMAKP